MATRLYPKDANTVTAFQNFKIFTKNKTKLFALVKKMSQAHSTEALFPNSLKKHLDLNQKYFTINETCLKPVLT